MTRTALGLALPAEWDPVDAVWDLEVGLNWLQVKAGLLPTSTDLLPD